MAKSTKKFYGNKTAPKHEGYFCGRELDRVATGARITYFRKEKMNFTQDEFLTFLRDGGYLQISKQTLWKWEKGLVKLEAEQIQALCEAFGCAHHELAVYRIREIDDGRGQPDFLIQVRISSGRVSAAAGTRPFVLPAAG